MFISTNTDSIDAEFTTLYVVVTRTTHKNSQQIDIVAGVYISLPMANNLAILLASMPAYQLVVRSESNSGCKEIMGLVEDIRTDIIVLDFGVYFSQSENGFVLVAGGKVRGVYLQMPRAEAAALCRSNTGQKGVRIEVWEVDRKLPIEEQFGHTFAAVAAAPVAAAAYYNEDDDNDSADWGTPAEEEGEFWRI